MADPCGSAKCSGSAVARCFWPGRQPILFCQPCVDRARAVMQAMGQYVHVEALPGFTEIPGMRETGRDGDGE